MLFGDFTFFPTTATIAYIREEQSFRSFLVWFVQTCRTIQNSSLGSNSETFFLGALEDTYVIHCDMKMGVSYDAETFYKYGKYRSKVVFVEGNGLLLVACSATMLNFCVEWDYFLSENCTNLSHSK